jgi:hypothetical protein
MQLSGSETLSMLDTSHPASSTSGRSKTSTRPISAASRNATSSPASVSGRTPFALPDGLTTDLFGLVPARANLSARQAKDLGLLTSATSGLPGRTSSASAALCRSVESRLQAAMPSHGGTLFALTWKTRATPAGLSISALRASARRTSDSGSSGWPTPAAHEPGGTPEQQVERAVRARARGVPVGNTKASGLATVVQYATWATPATRDWHSASGSPGFLAERAKQTRGKPLSEQVFTLASWATPTAHEKARSAEFQEGRQLNAREALASGTPATGSNAATASAGQLNPAHSRWLMGLPPAWDDCAPTATRSSRRSQRNS